MLGLFEGIVTEIAVAGSSSVVGALVLFRKKLPVGRKRFDSVSNELAETKEAADKLEKINLELMERYLDATSHKKPLGGMSK